MDVTVFLTPDEAAKVLRTSVRSLERRRVEGNGPQFVKLGRRVLYRPEDIDAWACDHSFASTAEVEAAT